MTEPTDQMGIFDVIYHCRAMRRLDTREVPEELLRKLVDAGNQAPTGSNMQGVRWIIARDAAVKRELADLNRHAVEAYIGPRLEQLEEVPHQSPEKRRRMLDSVLWQMEHMHELPALIVACLDFGEPATPARVAGGGASIWPAVQTPATGGASAGAGGDPDHAGAGRTGGRSRGAALARDDGPVLPDSGRLSAGPLLAGHAQAARRGAALRPLVGLSVRAGRCDDGGSVDEP